jgi:hypothetical protein
MSAAGPVRIATPVGPLGPAALFPNPTTRDAEKRWIVSGLLQDFSRHREARSLDRYSKPRAKRGAIVRAFPGAAGGADPERQESYQHSAIPDAAPLRGVERRRGPWNRPSSLRSRRS